LLALKSYAVSSRVVLQCRDSLQELALSTRVRLVWVPVRCGIHGNEEADALAREGSSSAFVETESSIGTFKCQAEGARVVTQILELGVSRQSRLWLKKPNPGLTRYSLRLTRSKLRILVGLITGH
jgi:hypothetical protein